MVEKKNIPEIRFKGFSEEWEDKKVEDVADFLDEKRKPLESGKRQTGTYPYYGASGIIDYVKDFIFNEELILLSEDGANIIDRNYRISFLAKGKYWVNNHAHVLKCKDNYSNSFICEYLESLNYEKFNTGTAQPKLNQEVCRNIAIKTPKILEQEKIGTYFQNLDQLITQHQAKHDKLLNIKKAMLEKMFPKNGTAIPEIRFKGFDGEWDEMTLGEITSIKTGFPFDSKDFDENGDYLVITNGNIQNNSPFVDNTKGNRVNIEKDTSISEYILHINDILVTMDGTVGRTAKVLGQKQILAQRVGRLIPKSEPEFLYQLLSTGHFYNEMILISTGGTIKHISLRDIFNYSMKIPKEKEQKEIGIYFQNLDNLISFHKKELEKLSNIKKALLEKMFV